MALGAEALIVSNRRVNGGVEILATDQTSLNEAEAKALSAHMAREASTASPPSASMPSMATGQASAGSRSATSGQAPLQGARPSIASQPAMPKASTVMGAPTQTGTSGFVSPSSIPQSPSSMPGVGVNVETPRERMDAAATMPPATRQDADVMSALGSMRGALESRIDELLWGSQLRRAPQAVSLFHTLLGFGFSTALVRAMLKQLPDHFNEQAAFQWARNELIKHLPVAPDESELWRPGSTVALVGPTGVGKTTTIAKLAARCVQRFGANRVALITTDTYRIGADDQLKIYGQMMQIPVHVAQDALELSRVMRSIAPSQLVLIDNVGISQRDRYVLEQAAMLARSTRPVSRLLVLNAASHGDTLDEVARKYTNDGGTPLRGCIISKVDEASRLGAALDTAVRYKLPIHYVSTGQKVPQDLKVLTAAALVDQALMPGPSASALYVPTEADLAALVTSAKDAEQEVMARSAAQRRNRLLPHLLATGSNGAALDVRRLEEASHWIDTDTACSLAYSLWREVALTGEGDALVVDEGADRPTHEAFSQAQSEVLRQGGEVMLAAYDGASLGSKGEGRLRSIVLLTAQGQPLSAPWHQLQLSDGWLSSDGQAGQQECSQQETIKGQIRWVQEHAVVPVVHLLDSSQAPLWRDLSNQELPWLAPCAGRTRVFVDDCATTVGAVAKTLVHRPMESTHYPGLTLLQGRDVQGVAVWVAGTTVQHMSRQAPPLTLHMISVKIVDRQSGVTVKTLLGLANTALPSMSHIDSMAAWLLTQAELKTAWRFSGSLWQQLMTAASHTVSMARAAASMQAGVAAWQVMQAPGAHSVRDVMKALSGKPQLAGRAVPASLARLFALKEML